MNSPHRQHYFAPSAQTRRAMARTPACRIALALAYAASFAALFWSLA